MNDFEKAISPEGGELPKFEKVPTVDRTAVDKIQREFINKKSENDNARDEIAIGPTGISRRKIENAIARNKGDQVIIPKFNNSKSKRQ